MKKRITNIALAFVSMIGLFGLYVTYGATPAYAAWECPSSTFCAWDFVNGTATKWELPSSSYPPGHCYYIYSSKGRGQWTSVWNRLPNGQRVNIYNNSFCSLPSAVSIQSNQKVNLPNLNFDNQNYSIRVFQ